MERRWETDRHRGRAALLTVAILLAAALCACSDQGNAATDTAPIRWPMYQYGPGHNALFSSRRPAASWRFTTGGKINGGLALAGGTVFAESFDSTVYALDERTGVLRWKTAAPNVVMTTPIVADGVVIVGTGTSDVAVDTPTQAIWGRAGGDVVEALDSRDGHVVWTYATVGEDMPSPALVRVSGVDAVVFANGDDHVRALAVRSGKLLWAVPLMGIGTMSSAAAADGRAFLVAGMGSSYTKSGGSKTYAIDFAGKIAWQAPYGNADCSPAVLDGRVFVETAIDIPTAPAARHYYDDVEALDARTGRLLWRRPSSPGHFTTVGSDEEAVAGLAAGGVLYQSLVAPSQFAALDARTGHVLWILPTGGPVKMSATLRNGRLFFGDTNGEFYVVRAVDGHVLYHKKFASFFTTSSPVIDGATLFIANDEAVDAIPLVDLGASA